MKKALIIIAIALGIIFAIIAAFGALVFLGSKGLSSRQPTEAEKSMLLTVETFEEYGYVDMPPEGASWNAKVNLDNTIELEYDYDSDIAGSTNFINITSEVSLDPTEKDAKTNFILLQKAFLVGLKIGGASSEETPELISIGDQNYCAIIFAGENPMGNIVMVRKGRIVHSLMLIGLYFDEPGYLDDLMNDIVVNSDPSMFGTD